MSMTSNIALLNSFSLGKKAYLYFFFFHRHCRVALCQLVSYMIEKGL